jgi:hypothetical protein
VNCLGAALHMKDILAASALVVALIIAPSNAGKGGSYDVVA